MVDYNFLKVAMLAINILTILNTSVAAIGFPVMLIFNETVGMAMIIATMSSQAGSALSMMLDRYIILRYPIRCIVKFILSCIIAITCILIITFTISKVNLYEKISVTSFIVGMLFYMGTKCILKKIVIVNHVGIIDEICPNNAFDYAEQTI